MFASDPRAKGRSKLSMCMELQLTRTLYFYAWQGMALSPWQYTPPLPHMYVCVCVRGSVGTKLK